MTKDKKLLSPERAAAQQLRKLREQRGFSYEEMAARMRAHGSRVTGPGLYKTEKGEPPRKLTIDDLVAASQVLGVSTDRILAPPTPSEMWALRTELKYCEVSLIDAANSVGTDYGERVRLLLRLEELLSLDVPPVLDRLGEMRQARHQLSPARDLNVYAGSELPAGAPVAAAEFCERRDVVLPELDRLIAELEAESGD